MKKYPGFAMPAVIIITSALIGISVVLLQSVVSARTTTLSNYYLKLAEEAAEAGTAYATACLEKNYHNQTWGNSDSPLNKLTQNSDCSGNQTAFPDSSVVASDGRIQSRFVVGNLEYGNDNTVQILSTGYAEIKTGATSSVSKTYTSVVKKTITWATNLSIEKSVSGTRRTCGILTGSVYCWGTNEDGQLGNGTNTNSNVPVKVKRVDGVLGSKQVTDMAAGSFFNCVIAEGEVFCWGLNDRGQLGNGNYTSSNVPVKVNLPAGSPAVKIGTSSSTACAILSNATLWCWGNGRNGELGNGSSGTSVRSHTPIQITVTSPNSTTSGALDLNTSGAFADHMCAIYSLTAGGSRPYCWGDNTYGQIGNNTSGNTITRPTAVSYAGGYTASEVPIRITLDGDVGNEPHTCLLTQSGRVFCWGVNTSGVLGYGAHHTNPSNTNGKKIVPIEISYTNITTGSGSVTEIAAGASHTCLIAGGRVYCWGRHSGQVGDPSVGQGQLGYGFKDYGINNLPKPVEEKAGALLGKTAYNLAAGAIRSCVSVENRVFCWGAGTAGQIGDGQNLSRHTPTESIFLRPRNNQYIY